MKTRSELLKIANEGFPGYWKFLRESELDLLMRLPSYQTFPVVLKMTVSKITQEDDGLKWATLLLDVRISEVDKVVNLVGASLGGKDDPRCKFYGIQAGLRELAEKFTFYLIFNVMHKEGIDVADWQNLSE